MLKKMLALGLIATGTLGVTITAASASEVQQSNQVIGSTTVAVDDSYSESYNNQHSQEYIFDGFGYPSYGDQEVQQSNQIIHSSTVAVDDSTAYSDNEQSSVIENYEDGFWYPFYY
jgi:hypothetical protein